MSDCFPLPALEISSLPVLGQLYFLAIKKSSIHLARMDKVVFLNLQGNLGVYFLGHPLHVQIPSGIQFFKTGLVTQPISSNMPSQLTCSGQEV